MEILDQILKILKGISTSDGVSLYVKAILIAIILIFSTVGSVWYKIRLEKARKKKAEEDAARDETRTREANERDGSQTEEDAGDLRDQIRNQKRE